MSYDLKITGGTIIDGTGREGFTGDIAVKDGKIAEVGKVTAPAERVIDAGGALVTPGFVDIHTHYDGQVSWDADMAPSSHHGVTTCVMGSCGVGFAPCRPEDHDKLIELMEGVEDIPGTALAEGLTWKWETFPEYMNGIDFPHAIDFCVQVPHDPLRVYVMGERGVADEPATDEDIARMRALTRAALEAGAVGFSTGRTDNHRTAIGAPTPASEAATRELTGIAEAFRGLRHGVLQAVSDFDMVDSADRFDAEFDVIEKMAEASGGHPLSVSLLQRDQQPNQWKQIVARAEQATARGVPIHLQVAPRPIGVLLGLEATFHPFMGFPSYKAISPLPLAERVAKLRDPERKRKLLTEKSEPVAGDGSPIPPLADKLLAHLDMVAMRTYRWGESPVYEPARDQCILWEAHQKGQGVLETVYDALLEDEGRALLYFPLYNYTEINLDIVHSMLTHPLALSGLSDGGAHVGTICDASFPTFLLMHWGRDRAEKQIPLERLVQMQTADTARYIGLADRGTIAPGQKADLNVIDFERLALRAPRLQSDLPAGGQRFLQAATGYVATINAGQVVAEGGALTGARPGRLVRLGDS